MQFLSLGGAGVWWPNRVATAKSATQHQLTHIPLSQAEEQIALDTQVEDGFKIYASIGGYSDSSARTELAAGIIAVCASGPIHIGTLGQIAKHL